MRQFLAVLVVSLTFCATLPAVEDPHLALLQGNWEVTELVEDGKVIPREAIREWLPSGGRVRIVDNAIIFQSPEDGRKHAKVFSIDATRFPKGIEISSRDQQVSQGIYRLDEGRLIVCLSDPIMAVRPEDFSAAEGSKRVLMVLNRLDRQSAPPALPRAETATATATQTNTAATVLTDAQVKAMLVGTWQLNDGLGPIFATIHANGTFETTRQRQEIQVFQTVFVRTPVSSGTWTVANGQLTYHVAASTHLERAGRTISLYVRSISARDLIFVDALGRVGTGVRVQ